MERFGTTDFDNNSRLITLTAIIMSGLHCNINGSDWRALEQRRLIAGISDLFKAYTGGRA
jgi:hypothetical protein